VQTSEDLEAVPLEMLGTTTRDSVHHLAFVHAPSGQESFFVDGQLAATGTRAGDFSVWDSGHSLCVAADQNDGAIADKWFGNIYRVAIHCNAFDDSEVAAAVAAGY
jgi:hypothetical protein